MVAPVPTGPIHAGEAVAVLGAGAGFLWWLRKPFGAILRVAGHEARLSVLEDAAATKTEMRALADDLRNRDNDHETRDLKAFQDVNTELAHIRENMAQKTDLARVEGNLTEILMDGFKKASR